LFKVLYGKATVDHVSLVFLNTAIQ
jgi:hypothetical protein